MSLSDDTNDLEGHAAAAALEEPQVNAAAAPAAVALEDPEGNAAAPAVVALEEPEGNAAAPAVVALEEPEGNAAAPPVVALEEPEGNAAAADVALEEPEGNAAAPAAVALEDPVWNAIDALLADRDPAVLRALRLVYQAMKPKLAAGRFFFHDSVFDGDGNDLGQFSDWLWLAAMMLPRIEFPKRRTMIVTYDIENYPDEPPPVIDPNQLDAFFRALAKKRSLKDISLKSLNREELRSFTEQFSRHRRQHLDRLALGFELGVDLEGIVGRLVRVSKKISFDCSHPRVPQQHYQTIFQDVRRELEQEALEEDANVTLEFSEIREENMDGLAREMTTLADIPSVDYKINYDWNGESLQRFSQVPRLSLRLQLWDPVPALSAERCKEISNNIRGCKGLEKLQLQQHVGHNWRNGGSPPPGFVDLVKSVVAGLDKNSSLQELRIEGISTGYHDVLWNALSKNENAKLEGLHLLWNENEARAIWEGLVTNTTVCDFTFSWFYHNNNYDDSFSARSLRDSFDALTKRNTLLRETETFCKPERNPREFVDKLCELSEESSQYYTDAVERFTNRNDPEQEQDQHNRLPANFSALFVAIRQRLPVFLNARAPAILIKLPLKDATDEDLRTLDLEAYGDMSNESRETILRICSETMRRNRELERRCREVEEVNRN